MKSGTYVGFPVDKWNITVAVASLFRLLPAIGCKVDPKSGSLIHCLSSPMLFVTFIRKS